MIARMELQQVDLLRPVLNAGLWLLLAASAFVAAFAGTTLAAAATPPLELRGGADLVSRLDAGYTVDAQPQRLRRLDPRVIDQAAADERMLNGLLGGASSVATDRRAVPSMPVSPGLPQPTTNTASTPSAPIEAPGAGLEAAGPAPAQSVTVDVNSAPAAAGGAERPPTSEIPGSVLPLRDAPAGVLVPVVNAATGVVTPVVDSVVGGVVAPVVETVTGGVAPVVETVTGGVAPVVETVTGGVAPVVETVTGGVAPVVETVTGGVAPVIENVLGGLFH